MIVADLGRAAAIASIPLAYWFGHLTLVQLYVVERRTRAAQRHLRRLVPLVPADARRPGASRRGELEAARHAVAAQRSPARRSRAGSSRAVGAPVAVLADAVSFAFSGAFVTTIRGREERPEPTPTRARTELMEGLRYVFGQPYLRTLTTWFSIGNLFNSALFAARDRLLRPRPAPRRRDDRLAARAHQRRLHRRSVRERPARSPVRNRPDDRVPLAALSDRARHDSGGTAGASAPGAHRRRASPARSSASSPTSTSSRCASRSRRNGCSDA